jgi:hypothetical protein
LPIRKERLNSKGQEITTFQYDKNEDYQEGIRPLYFTEGLMPVYKNNQWGYINTQGREVIPCEYDMVYNFSNGLARVNIGGKLGFIDKKNKIVIPIEYDLAYDFSEGLAPVEKKGKMGIIDTLGNVVVPIEYEYIGSAKISEGLIPVMKKMFTACGYIDIKNNIKIPFEYRNVSIFSEGLAKVYLNGGWGYIDSTDTQIIPFMYKMAEDFKDGVGIVANQEMKYGAINKKNEMVIPFLYKYIGFGILTTSAVKVPVKQEENVLKTISEGLIPAYLEEKAGILDLKGKVIIPFIYEYVAPFKGGLALVLKNGKWGYIDNQGVEYFED